MNDLDAMQPPILLAEDEGLLAMEMMRLITTLGFAVAGPVPTVARAEAIARSQVLAAAVLDINLRGEFVFPAVKVLREADVPVVLVTGYDGETVVPPELRDIPRLAKPCILPELRRTLAGVGLPTR